MISAKLIELVHIHAARLADDVGTPSISAAAVKLPVSTTRTKTAIRFKSIRSIVAIAATKLCELTD